MPTQFELGFLTGLLVGEGHFGGDGRQPQVTLRMHARHEAIFRWLERAFPGGRLYGPYHHGGRHYLQWMARGPFLRDELAPLLDRLLSPDLDRHSFDRYQLMKAHYPQLTSDLAVPDAAGPASAPDGRPAATRAEPGAGASDDGGRASASVSSVESAEAAADLDELFSRLRENWPS